MNDYSKDALIVVDMQNDFAHKMGSLYVTDGYKLVDPINELIPQFGTVVLTKDMHPEYHCSFNIEGGLWPIHCVKGTWGSEFIDNLNYYDSHLTIYKGYEKEVDSYSAFKDSVGKRSGLNGYLAQRYVRKVYVVGLALDFCVSMTAIDAKLCGFDTYVALNLTKAVTEIGKDRAIDKLEFYGIEDRVNL